MARRLLTKDEWEFQMAVVNGDYKLSPSGEFGYVNRAKAPGAAVEKVETSTQGAPSNKRPLEKELKVEDEPKASKMPKLDDYFKQTPSNKRQLEKELKVEDQPKPSKMPKLGDYYKQTPKEFGVNGSKPSRMTIVDSAGYPSLDEYLERLRREQEASNKKFNTRFEELTTSFNLAAAEHEETLKECQSFNEHPEVPKVPEDPSEEEISK